TNNPNKDKNIFVYNANGSLRGSWTATGYNQAQDITTDGTNIWIVDDAKDKVYKFNNAASLLSGTKAYDSAWDLAGDNKNSSGIVTNGQYFWVTDIQGSSSRVVVYDMAGNKKGSWQLDPANVDPSGVTLNPAGGSDLWVVDRQVDKVFYYAGAQGRRDGSQN